MHHQVILRQCSNALRDAEYTRYNIMTNIRASNSLLRNLTEDCTVTECNTRCARLRQSEEKRTRGWEKGNLDLLVVDIHEICIKNSAVYGIHGATLLVWFKTFKDRKLGIHCLIPISQLLATFQDLIFFVICRSGTCF
jgi:hypothetical protein